MVDTVSTDDHATHVAGTIGATGQFLPAARGMASGVNIRSRNDINDTNELVSDAGLIDISNHSYSRRRGWGVRDMGTGFGLYDTWETDRSLNAIEDPNFGKYDGVAQGFDDALYDNPNLLSIWSAGNDRDDTFTDDASDGDYVAFFSQDPGGIGYTGPDWYQVPETGNPNTTAPPDDGNSGTGYDSLPQQQTAKNTLVVGAIDDITVDDYDTDDVVMTAYSSWGPTDDGRIKPDLVANGHNLTSTAGAGDTLYYTEFGTSMSAPNVTGTAALLVEHYRNLFGDGNPSTNSYPNLFDDDNPRSATTKGLLIHTAFDAGNVEPDYSNGWGVVDAAAAAEFLTEAEQGSGSTDHLFERAYDGNTWALNVHSDGSEPLRVTIVWTDPAPTTLPGGGLDDATSVLVNDLDSWITNSSGTVFYRAWNLDSANPAATR